MSVPISQVFFFLLPRLHLLSLKHRVGKNWSEVGHEVVRKIQVLKFGKVSWDRTDGKVEQCELSFSFWDLLSSMDERKSVVSSPVCN